jgi:WS/DGAT/MGAT family acyltransferase
MTESEARPLRGWDAATWRGAEGSPALRSPMVGVLVLDKAPDWARLTERMDRVTRVVPRLRERPLRQPLPFGSPRLAVDPDFDLAFHLRRYRLPSPATWDDVLDEARRQSLADFDNARPLWRATLLEGLPGGRAVFVLKLHHALADGQAAIALGAALFDFSADAAPLDDGPAAPESGSHDAMSLLASSLKDGVDLLAGVAVGAASHVLPALRDLAESPVDTTQKLLDTLRSVWRFTNVPDGPLSPIMTGRSTTYRFGTFSLPFRQIQRTARDSGQSVNDVFMAAVAGGMRRYHERHGAEVDELRFNLPISLRGNDSGNAANAVTIARFHVPVGEANPEVRMRLIGEVVSQWRAEPALGFADGLADLSRFVPVELLAQAARASDVTTSNVMGVPVPVYLVGAQVLQMFPLVATIGAAVNVTMITYDGKAEVGFSADEAAVDDIENLTDDLRAGFGEVLGSTPSADSPLRLNLEEAAQAAADEIGPQAFEVPKADKNVSKSARSIATGGKTPRPARKPKPAAE